MKWLFIILGIIIAIVLIVAIVGYSLPAKHKASMQVVVHATPEQVWQRVTNVSAHPTWRKGLKSVEVKNASEWVEVDKYNDKLPMKMTIVEPGRRLVTTITGKDLPYGGNWEFTLEPQGGQTLVTLTENGEVYNPIFRFVSKFIMGHTATLKAYAADLQASFK